MKSVNRTPVENWEKGQAAMRRGLIWRAIGIEIEERYCEIAAKRPGQSVISFNDKEDARCERS